MNNIIRILTENNHKAFIVGGYVRDLVLKKENKDIDIVTSASLEEVKTLLKGMHIVDTGLKHGTVLVIDNDIHYELTTFRGAKDSLEDDLKKRDFTMNSLILDKNEIIDYVEGIDDIKAKLIRTNGNPYERFMEDPLRILRAIRFSSTLDFKIEEETKKAMKDLKHLLLDVSNERIYSELVQILMGDKAGNVILENVDILGVIIPELIKMKGFNQQNPHHVYDLLEHTCVVIDECPKDQIIRLSAFFHDFGKLDTFTIDDQGIGHFYRHELYSQRHAKRILRHLKCDKKTVYEVSELALHHTREIAPTKKSVRKILSIIGYDQFKRLISLKVADNLGHNPEYHHDLSSYDTLLELAEEIINAEEALSLTDLKISGSDVIKLGFNPGAIIGEILNDCFERVVSEELDNNKDILIDYITKKYL